MHLVRVLLLAVIAGGAHAAVEGELWAVIASTSRFWFNYRHDADALTVYDQLKRAGLPDSRIVLMLSGGAACDDRNRHEGTVYHLESGSKDLRSAGDDRVCNLHRDGTEVDYRGAEVTSDAFRRVLTGHHAASEPASRRLGSGPNDRVLVYISGHGGDGFSKFQDIDILGTEDVKATVAEAHKRGRFREMLFLIDSCQAATVSETISTPGVLAISSSGRGENSYAMHPIDIDIGNAMVDRFTHYLGKFLDGGAQGLENADAMRPSSAPRVGAELDAWAAWLEATPLTDALAVTSRGRLGATLVVRDESFGRPLASVRLADFFLPLRGGGAAAAAAAAAMPTRSGSEAAAVRAEWVRRASHREQGDDRRAAASPAAAAAAAAAATDSSTRARVPLLPPRRRAIGADGEGERLRSSVAIALICAVSLAPLALASLRRIE